MKIFNTREEAVNEIVLNSKGIEFTVEDLKSPFWTYRIKEQIDYILIDSVTNLRALESLFQGETLTVKSPYRAVREILMPKVIVVSAKIETGGYKELTEEQIKVIIAKSRTHTLAKIAREIDSTVYLVRKYIRENELERPIEGKKPREIKKLFDYVKPTWRERPWNDKINLITMLPSEELRRNK